MKKLILGLIATVMIGNLSYGQRFSSEDFKHIGVEHNRLLDVAYNKILKDKVTNENKEVVIDVLIEDFENQKYSKEDLELGKKLIKEAFESLPKKGEKIEVSEKVYSDKISDKLDDNVKKYLDRLNNLIDKNSNSVKEFNAVVGELENTIEKDESLKNEQLIVLFSATNVARYSYQYWAENSKEWQNLGNNSSINAKGILREDVKGAVGGAVTAIAVNLIPGLGQVGYGSAIIGGAIGNSAIQACSDFMDWCGL